MQSATYPQLLIFDNELELAETPQERADLLHGLTNSELKNVVVLNAQLQYCTLSNDILPPLSANELTGLVKHYLQKEGHCCLAKLANLTKAQAFTLIAID